MNDQNLMFRFTVDQTPEEVYEAINNVRAWWSGEIEGPTDELNAEFTYRYKDIHYSKQHITTLVPGEKVVWHVTDGYFSFTKNPTEWVGTDVVFEISKKGDKTELVFTHIGLVPSIECYHACFDGWNFYINTSLKNFITSGQGQPNTGEAKTDSEKALS